MDDINPYAAPRTPQTLVVLDESWVGLWRDGKNQQDLVMHKDAKLPNRCVKSGVEVTELGIERKFSWHNPWLGLALLIHPIIYFGFALAFSKKATVRVPLSHEQRTLRQKKLVVWWIVGVANVFLLLGCFSVFLTSVPNPITPPIVGMIIGMIGMFTALFVGKSVSLILRPMKITESKIWLRGVHPSILETLPLLPDEMTI